MGEGAPGSVDGVDDPVEQPWGFGPGGRHALGRRAAVVRVEELLRSFAVEPQPHQFNEALSGGAAVDGSRDVQVAADLEVARDEIARLTALLRAAQGELATVRERADVADAALASRRAEFEDHETRWELRQRELEKELEELAGELAERAEDGQVRDAEQVADEIERLRGEAERARAEAEDAGAEADAAFVELAEAFAALSAAESRLAELEASTGRRA